MWFEYTVIGAFVVTWWWHWRCCRKAQEAYWAAERLYEWVKTVHAPLICTVNATGDCKNAGPDWPPKELQGFPPTSGT